MSVRIEELNVAMCAELFGATQEEIADTCGAILSSKDFRFVTTNNKEKEKIVLEVMKTIDSRLSVSGVRRHDDWENGWNENLRSFIESGYSLLSLTPRYMHKSNTRRLFSQYISPLHGDFEVNFYTAYRHFLFKKYLRDYEHVYEFGCGTGYNLVMMAQFFPEKTITGLDWTASSVNLVNEIASQYGYRLHGRHFNFFEPDYSLEVAEQSAFITLNSMEQIGKIHDKFLEFILRKKPAICINSEPFLELYDQDNLLDYLAAKYHKKRKYLENYLTALQKYERKGVIDILKVQRVHSGNLFHDGYSYVVWRIK